MLRRLVLGFTLVMFLFPLAAQDMPPVLTDSDIVKFIETYPAIEAEMEKKSAEYEQTDPLQDNEDISSMMASLFAYDWVREIFQSHGWDEEFMMVKFPAIMSGVMVVSVEKALGEMNEKERAAMEASGMIQSLVSAFGQVNQKDKDVILRHLDDLVFVLDAGDDSGGF